MSLDVTPAQLRFDPVAFADAVVKLNEKGQPWRLARHQRRVLARAFRRSPAGRLLFRLIVLADLKKSGKTFVAAVLVLWWAITVANTEIILAANDQDQSVSRVFRTVVALIRHNPWLASHVTVLATELRFKNGTVVTAIASDYRGAAGSRHSLYVVDEPWGFTQESAERLVEELTPPPTEPDAWGLWVTTAGWVGESQMLERVYQRGLGGAQVDDELEMYESDDLFMFWSHTPRMPWQVGPEGERYYAEQRRSLRPSTYARLHENRWVSAESVFITPELWDPCVDEEHHPELPSHDDDPVYVGVDAGVKSDNLGVVEVKREGTWLTLVRHRLWRPSPTEPLDLEETIEAYLLDRFAQCRIGAIYCDPWQMYRSIATLRAKSLPIMEFPQTQANTTRMGQALYELLTGTNLRLYPSAEMRQQALNTVAIESARGFRIAKERASKKIDLIAALSLACVACLDQPQYVPVALWGGGVA